MSDLRHWLDTIETCGSVRKAAAVLGVSPQAISKRFTGLMPDHPDRLEYTQLLGRIKGRPAIHPPGSEAERNREAVRRHRARLKAQQEPTDET